MKNVTFEVHKFKEASRHVWNAYFACISKDHASDVYSHFDRVENGLLWAIIGAPVGAAGIEEEYRTGPIKRLLVKIKDIYRKAPIRVGRLDSSKNIIWGNEQIISRIDDDVFWFIEFFDWDRYGFSDQPYVRVFIKTCNQDAALEGFSAIIEMRYVEFFLL